METNSTASLQTPLVATVQFIVLIALFILGVGLVVFKVRKWYLKSKQTDFHCNQNLTHPMRTPIKDSD